MRAYFFKEYQLFTAHLRYFNGTVVKEYIKVSTVSCKFLHGDIGDDGDIANIANIASAISPKRLDILLENVYTFLNLLTLILI